MFWVVLGGHYAESWRRAMQEEWELEERTEERWQKEVARLSLRTVKSWDLEEKEAAV